MFDGVEEILEVVDEIFVKGFVIPALGALTKFAVENLEASRERGTKATRRVVHLADKARADPPGHFDSFSVHLSQVRSSRGTSALFKGVQVRYDRESVVRPHPGMMEDHLSLGGIIVFG